MEGIGVPLLATRRRGRDIFKAGPLVPGEGDGVNGATKGEQTASKDSQKGSELDCGRNEELVVSLPVLYFLKGKSACLY